eukprot:IDg5212t1
MAQRHYYSQQDGPKGPMGNIVRASPDEDPFSTTRFDNLRRGGFSENTAILRQELFIEYESTARETVKAVFGAPSIIIGKDGIRIPIDGGRAPMAYHAPQLEMRILSVSYTATKINLRSSFKVNYLG